MAEEAIAEIKAILQKQGGSGRVWVKGWSERFAALGSLRDFLDEQSDEFTIIPGEGAKFTVALARRGAKGKGKGKRTADKVATVSSSKGKGKQTTGKSAALALTNGSGRSGKTAGKGGANSKVIGEAIREIKQQLQAQGGIGYVWVDDWKERFSELGRLRDFMESRPDKFTLSLGPGRKFVAALAGVDIAAAPAGQKAAPSGQKAGSRQQKGGPGGGRNSVVGEAIREIKASLQEQGGSGRVFIENWRGRFADELGDSLRAFLESRPDKFQVVPGQGSSFTVAIAGAKGQGGAGGAGAGAKRKRSEDGGGQPPKKVRKEVAADADDLADMAISEIEKQLEDPKNTNGKVWIANWNSTYKDALGAMREFLESRPDKFVVSAADGKGYRVYLA